MRIDRHRNSSWPFEKKRKVKKTSSAAIYKTHGSGDRPSAQCPETKNMERFERLLMIVISQLGCPVNYGALRNIKYRWYLELWIPYQWGLSKVESRLEI